MTLAANFVTSGVLIAALSAAAAQAQAQDSTQQFPLVSSEVLTSNPQAAKRRVHKVKLGYVVDHPISMAAFSSLMGSLNGILWDKSSETVCETAEFSADGEPGEIVSSLPQTIESESDFLAYASSSYSVHVVDAIRWCGGSGSRIIGCARRGGPVLVVERPDLDQLMLHEIGHAQDLDHMDEFPNNIMYPQVLPESRQLLAFQCKRYSAAQLYPALASAEAPLTPTQPQPQPQRAEQQSGVSKQTQIVKREMTFDEFMRAGWTHFDLAAARIEKMNESEVSQSRDFIEQNKYEYWPNAITVIGLKGKDPDIKLFRSVLESNIENGYVREAKLNLPRALGFFVYQTKSIEAAKLLSELKSPVYAATYASGDEKKKARDGRLMAQEATAGNSIAAAAGVVSSQAAVDEQQDSAKKGSYNLGVSNDFFAGNQDLKETVKSKGLFETLKTQRSGM